MFLDRASDFIGQAAQDAAEWLDRGHESWQFAHVDFVSRAQKAARRALYFVRQAEPGAPKEVLDHARRNAMTILEGVSAPPPLDVRSSGPYSGAREPYSELIKKWKGLMEGWLVADAPNGPADVESRIREFLHASEPRVRAIRWSYVRLPVFGRFLRQHLAFFLGGVIAVAIFARVEAVASLFRNDPLHSFFAVVLALAPLVLVQGPAEWWRRTRAHRGPPAWDFGGPLARASKPVAYAPPPWIPWHASVAKGERGYFADIIRSLALKVLLHAVWWVLLFFLFDALRRAGIVEEAFLTVYVIAVALVALAFVGAAADHLDIHSPAPLRLGIVVSAALFGAAVIISDDTATQAGIVIVLAGVIGFGAWRVKQLAAAWPLAALTGVMLTALAVGESRSTSVAWTSDSVAAPLIGPDAWPAGSQSDGPVVVVAASGGGSRAALMLAHTLTRLDADEKDVASRVQAISAVSGGSLATAGFVAGRLRERGLAPASADQCNSNLVEAMRGDFLRPALLGAVPFLGGRAGRIQRTWERCPGLGSIRIGDLAAHWLADTARLAGRAPFPVPIFNSVNLDRHAVVVTPLDGSYFRQPLDSFARSPERRPATDEGAWVFFRSGIYHHTDFGAGLNPRLTEAVRASANFPFGFPLVELETRAPLWYGPRESDADPTVAKVVRLTDGGVLSNSGLWPLVPMLLNRREVLQPRGLLLLVVDASKMPKAGLRDRQLGLLGAILDKAPKTERSHFQLLGQLEQAYGDCVAVVQIAVDPRRENNIHTTWTLDEHSQLKLDSLFAVAWDSARVEIADGMKRLKGCKGVQRAVPARRVPVS